MQHVIRISTLIPPSQKVLGLIGRVFSVELAGYLLLIEVSSHISSMYIVSYTGDYVCWKKLHFP